MKTIAQLNIESLNRSIDLGNKVIYEKHPLSDKKRYYWHSISIINEQGSVVSGFGSANKSEDIQLGIKLSIKSK
jgi:hypothetical protein